MSVWWLAIGLAAAVLFASGSSLADSDARLKPFHGTESDTVPGARGSRSEHGPVVPGNAQRSLPQGQRTTTPFGSPSPPDQLTPAPMLPFHPHGPLMPSPSPPAPNPSAGRPGR